jgi:POT family proton-dependent oligopeptide transporter
MARLGAAPGPVSKIGAGMIISAFAFVSLAVGGWLAPSETSVYVGWIVLAYALQSAGELLVVPTGMSAVTRLSVPRFAGLMMGLWFLAAAGAGVISSSVAKLAALDLEAGEAQSPEAALTLYTHLFIGIGIALAITGLVVLLSSRRLRRLMHGIEHHDGGR